MMNRRLLFVLCCTFLLAGLAFGTAAQGRRCNLDYTPVYTALQNSTAAQANGDMTGALAYLNEAFTLLESIKTDCGVASLNWCYPGQPWGDGRCNAPDLSQNQIDWFWACGTYWAEYDAGLLAAVPDWCGCDTAVDADCDGTPNSGDLCPGASDDDSDGDGVVDCNDHCPTDGSKSAPGACGCGAPETGDSDGDGVADCVDACPADTGKIAPGACGCGNPDTDSDLDGIANCVDACPSYGNPSCAVGWCQIFIPAPGTYIVYSSYPGSLVGAAPSFPDLPTCS